MKFKTAIGEITPNGEQIGIMVRNYSTVQISQYSVVVIDTSTMASNAFTGTTSESGTAVPDFNLPVVPVSTDSGGASKLVVGVLQHNLPGVGSGTNQTTLGGITDACVKGFTPVLKNAEAWAVGDQIVSSTTAGNAMKSASPGVGTLIGKCVYAQTGTTDTYGYIMMMPGV